MAHPILVTLTAGCHKTGRDRTEPHDQVTNIAEEGTSLPKCVHDRVQGMGSTVSPRQLLIGVTILLLIESVVSPCNLLIGDHGVSMSFINWDHGILVSFID